MLLAKGLALSVAASANVIPIQQHVLDATKARGDVHKVQDELKRAEIIPTVIADFLPSFMLEAEWSPDDYAHLGNTLEVGKLQDQPTLRLISSPASSPNPCSVNATYIVTLTDPDAPSRKNPKWAEMCHFIATGLATSSSLDGASYEMRLSELKDIVPYKPPGPPPRTGKHRYVFLVFAPANGTLEPLNLTKPDDRKHWGTGRERHGVQDWALSNGLAPMAANFIYAQNKEQ